jgi:hypothetical protein
LRAGQRGSTIYHLERGECEITIFKEPQNLGIRKK